MKSIDLNCDLGEGSGNDQLLMPLVSSINIACGGHAGDDTTMRQSVRIARQLGLQIGAHPGFEDRKNFGRKEIDLSTDAISDLIRRQSSKLMEIAQAENAFVRHIKPHGALYNMAARDPAISRSIIDAVMQLDRSLYLMVSAESITAKMAMESGLRVVREGFIDRSYQSDGSLTPRNRPNAALDMHAAVLQAKDFVLKNQVRTVDGLIRKTDVQSLCVHGDGPDAVTLLQQVREAMIQNGVEVKSYS